MRLDKLITSLFRRSLWLLLTNRVSAVTGGINLINLGEWLNGRVVVSKTIGCVFESRLPCQEERIIPFFLFCRGMDAYSTGKRKFLARLRVTRKRLDAIGQTYYFAIPSKPVASPYESRSAPKNGLFRSFCFAGETRYLSLRLNKLINLLFRRIVHRSNKAFFVLSIFKSCFFKI